MADTNKDWNRHSFMSLKASSYPEEWIARTVVDPSSSNEEKSSPSTTPTTGKIRCDDNKSKRSSRLVLHLDINETILLGDEAGGDSQHESLHKMIAKSAFCQIPPSHADNMREWTPTHWWNGQPITNPGGDDDDQNQKQSTLIPPLYTGWDWPKDSCPHYRTAYHSQSKRFVESHGHVYRPILEKCQELLHQQPMSQQERTHTSIVTEEVLSLIHI